MIDEMSHIEEQIREKWIVFWLSLAISSFPFMFAWRQGFFRPFEISFAPVIYGIDVLRGFGYFVLSQLFITVIFLNVHFLDLHETFSQPLSRAWLNLLITHIGIIGCAFAYLQLTKTQKHQIWGQTDHPWYYHVGMGIATWFLSYPLVLAFNQGLSLALWHFFHQPFVEQVAIQNVRHAMADPVLMGLTSLSVVTLVPIAEEFLFRGLLQSWLKSKFQNRIGAIALTSLIFSLFHFSSQHGITNIDLLSSLFLLSCMLGYLFERQRSLWAPIGLHSFFNLVSLLFLIFGSDH